MLEKLKKLKDKKFREEIYALVAFIFVGWLVIFGMKYAEPIYNWFQ